MSKLKGGHTIMKELYVSPVSDVKEFKTLDVVSTSGFDIGDGGMD